MGRHDDSANNHWRIAMPEISSTMQQTLEEDLESIFQAVKFDQTRLDPSKLMLIKNKLKDLYLKELKVSISQVNKRYYM